MTIILLLKNQLKYLRNRFKCLGENTEKYITFSVSINKELDNSKRITYKTKLIDSFRLMSTSLSSLVDNLSERVHSDKCSDCKSCLDYISVKDDQLIFKCSKCIKNYNKDFNKDLINRFASTYEFCDGDINKFFLLLRKGVCPYEYSSLNMEGITDVDDRHAKKVFKEFKMNNLHNYHDSYVQSDTILPADVFENFRNKCIEIYKLDPARFLSAPGLAWQACLRKTGIMLELLTNINILLMIEKRLRGGICHAIHRYVEANNKYIKSYIKNKESSYLMYLDANNLYGWIMSQKLPVNSFK